MKKKLKYKLKFHKDGTPEGCASCKTIVPLTPVFMEQWEENFYFCDLCAETDFGSEHFYPMHHERLLTTDMFVQGIRWLERKLNESHRS